MRDNFELEQEGYLASESFPEDSHDALLHAMSDSEIGFHDDHIEGMQRKSTIGCATSAVCNPTCLSRANREVHEYVFHLRLRSACGQYSLPVKGMVET